MNGHTNGMGVAGRFIPIVNINYNNFWYKILGERYNLGVGRGYPHPYPYPWHHIYASVDALPAHKYVVLTDKQDGAQYAPDYQCIQQNISVSQ